MAEVMSATYESLQTVLEPCRQVTSNNQTMQFTHSSSGNDWLDCEMASTENDTSCDVISFRHQHVSLISDQLTTPTASTYELVELEERPAVNNSVSSHHQLKRCDSQLQFTAASAGDTSLTQFNSVTDKRQTDRERIKKAKHNRVEKRRRSNINEHMKTLDSLLPKNVVLDERDSTPGNCKSKQNKGNILKETVAYIRILQQDQARLVSVEQRTRQLYSANRHIIARLKELEELLSSSDRSPRVSLSDLGLFIDDLDANIKEEPSYMAFTSRTDDVIKCSL